MDQKACPSEPRRYHARLWRRSVKREAGTTGSVGVVRTERVTLSLPEGGYRLDCGESLPELTVAYETYGRLSDLRDNAVFVCHALTGNAHAAGRHNPPDPEEPTAWWDEMIGPGKGIDTNHYFVVCANILGGCKGTTGPSSLDPRTGKPYGSRFPPITVGDIVGVHRLLLMQQFGVERLAAVVGGSFGGMQVIEWAIRFPDMLDRCISIASSTSLTAQALAFDIVGRKAIQNDPDFRGGDYYEGGGRPDKGLALARKVGHITYLSREMMTEKFGRVKWTEEDPSQVAGADSESRVNKFQVQTYLEHQGQKFVRRFDANSYLAITRAMDEYDAGAAHGGLEAAFARVKAKFLVVAVSSDWLFPREQSTESANALLRAGKRVSYCLLNAPHGHDAFLVDVQYLADVIHGFLPWVGPDASPGAGPSGTPAAGSKGASVPRREYEIIQSMVRPGSRLLDLGCADGDLLSLLTRQKQAQGLGMDLDIRHVIDVIDRGHDMFQSDIDAGLAMIPDGTYDYAILSETLQVVKKPRFVLSEMLRVAKEGIVSFPNFGNWRHRGTLGVAGRMPKGKALPFDWYNTPNIHLFTYLDFVELCELDRIRILDVVFLTQDLVGQLLVRAGVPNLGADSVLVRIARA